jgi:hypothetical protein
MMRKQPDHTNFKYWSRLQFSKLRSCVAFLETVSENGDLQIGTAFHVGDGAFVTARHVIENRKIKAIGFDDFNVSQELLRDPKHWGPKPHGAVSVVSGPHFHKDASVDVACFRAEPFPNSFIPLGGHFNDWMGQYEFVLHRTLVLGYPPIPLANRAVLMAGSGEVNALIDKYTGGHPHFIISTMARGGFSGAPVLVAYDEGNTETGTALLGLVTESLGANGRDVELGYMAVLTVEPIYACLEMHGLLPKFQSVAKAKDEHP